MFCWEIIQISNAECQIQVNYKSQSKILVSTKLELIQALRIKRKKYVKVIMRATKAKSRSVSHILLALTWHQIVVKLLTCSYGSLINEQRVGIPYKFSEFKSSSYTVVTGKIHQNDQIILWVCFPCRVGPKRPKNILVFIMASIK